MTAAPPGYLALLRRNRDFRRLWYAQVASQMGDWLDQVALYILVLRLTGGSGQALGGLMVAQFLPAALVGPFAGVVVDRLPRRSVMIAADLARAGLVPLYLLARDPSRLWLVYAVMLLKESLTAFFEPAREAAIPGIARPEELVAANAVSGATWSVMLVGGAALGGVVAGTLGTSAALLLDSASFLVSAFWIWAARAPEAPAQPGPRPGALREMAEGFAYLARRRRGAALYALSKTMWSLGGGGVLVVLTLFGTAVFPLGKDGALSTGLMYAARGAGAALGPLLAQRLGGSGVPGLRRWLGPGLFLMGAGYACLGASPALGLALGSLVLAHAGGSIQWVFSTTLLQLTVPSRLQGRVFALEMTLFALAASLSSYLTGAAADSLKGADFTAGEAARALSLALAGLFAPPALLMTLLLWRPATDD